MGFHTLHQPLGKERTVFFADDSSVVRNQIARTLENWEQGRASPNAQTAILIRMVERYPDTVERLSTI